MERRPGRGHNRHWLLGRLLLWPAALGLATSTSGGQELCVPTVSPLLLSAPSVGGTTSVTIAAPAGCAWNATSPVEWVTVLSPSGAGRGSAAIKVAPNDGSAPRTAILTVGGHDVMLTQAAVTADQDGRVPAAREAKAGSSDLGGLRIMEIEATPAESVDLFAKLEVTFDIAGSAATMMQWPHDASPPSGIPPDLGISVDAVFTDPDGRRFAQPAFYSERFLDDVRDGRDWHLPTGDFGWTVRFTPNRPGRWTYKIVARDRSGTVEGASNTFVVAPSEARGFVKVSRADTRYFEFDDGTPFHAMGFQLTEHLNDPSTRGGPEYAMLGRFGVNFVRVWISSIYGSAWSPWGGERNQYRGYLPVTGLLPFADARTGTTTLTMRLDYEPGGDEGWFDACCLQLWDNPESVKPATRYRLRVKYRAEGIEGPRDPRHPDFGLVAKLADTYPGPCYEPGTGTPMTDHGTNNFEWGYLEGTWYSGTRNFLPRMYLALENVRQGVVHVQSISLREDLGDGRLGPEMMAKPSFELESYIPEERAHALDKIVALAERHGVYLKLVVMDKDDKIYFKMADEGGWLLEGPDNEDGFYGLGRGLNKTRWLQQMWWRYLQARWGYSPAIHSWELTNEGDPSSVAHYELADEFGKFMHCRAFGVEPGRGDGAACTLDHPNDHLVTTSFWSGFPAEEFWSNPKYPNVDYADVHAYVSTSFAPASERERMQWDAAYYHLWHSQNLPRVGKPIVRGEGGLDTPREQSHSALGLDRDTTGVWLHNWLWSGIDSGGLYELYWWNHHIWSDHVDLRGEYAAVRRFLSDIPLNRGGYTDWGGTVSNPSLRVVGQKNRTTGSMHLWIQNAEYRWKATVDGVALRPQSAVVVIPGFEPRASYRMERWDTHQRGGIIGAVEQLTADERGALTIPVEGVWTDTALKVTKVDGRETRF